MRPEPRTRTMSDEALEEVTVDDGGWIFPSPWVGIAALFAAIGAAALLYIFTLPPDSVPTPVAGSALGLAIFAAAAVGYDAWTRGGPGSWSPTPLLWALPMLVPGLNVGVIVAYVGRHLQTRRPELRGLWVYPAVGASLLSGIAIYVLVVLDATTLPLSLPAATLQVANYAFIALAAAAAYYDTRYVEARLAENGDGWLLSGYHWVVLLSVPLPIRVLIALAYAGRRRMLLRGAPPVPGEPAAADDKA